MNESGDFLKISRRLSSLLGVLAALILIGVQIIGIIAIVVSEFTEWDWIDPFMKLYWSGGGNKVFSLDLFLSFFPTLALGGNVILLLCGEYFGKYKHPVYDFSFGYLFCIGFYILVVQLSFDYSRVDLFSDDLKTSLYAITALEVLFLLIALIYIARKLYLHFTKSDLYTFRFVDEIFYFLFIVVCVILMFTHPWYNPMHKKALDNVELGMSKEAVVGYLGNPHREIEKNQLVRFDAYIYYDYDVNKRYNKYNKLFDEGKEMKALEIYDELEAMDCVCTVITFENDQVIEIFYDTDHIYDEFNNYATRNDEVKSVEILGNVEGSYKQVWNSIYEELVLDLSDLPYYAEFGDGGYIKGYIGSSSIESINESERRAEISWKVGDFEFSSVEQITIQGDDE